MGMMEWPHKKKVEEPAPELPKGLQKLTKSMDEAVLILPPEDIKLPELDKVKPERQNFWDNHP